MLKTSLIQWGYERPTEVEGKGQAPWMGIVSGAYDPVVSITRCLLDGCRLVMWTDAGIWYMENNGIKEAAENFGVGLRLVELREVNNKNIEAIVVIFEPIPDAVQKSIYVHGIKRLPPANAYVLATDFAGEFGVLLYREDQKGERTFLWGEDYIFK